MALDPVSQVRIPRLKRDWIGRHVRLRMQMETKGGAIFEQGEVMLVADSRGGLELKSVRACDECRRRHRYSIKKIPERNVTLLPEDFKP